MNEKIYVVYTMNKKAIVKVLGLEKEIELSWIKGQIGALPVFSSRQAAEKYANGQTVVKELEI